MQMKLLFFLLVGSAVPALGQDIPEAGFPITLHIPEELCVRARTDVSCTLAWDGDAVAVGGKAGWEANSMPVAHQGTIRKWKFRKGVGTLVATVGSQEWTVRAQAATKEAALELLWTVHSQGGRLGKRAGEKFSAYAAAYAEQIFPMVEDVEARNLLVSSARGIGAVRVERIDYKDKAWAAIDLGASPGGVHYNTLQLSEVQRVATDLKKRALPTVLTFGAALKRAAPLEGFKISFQIGSRNFLNDLERIGYDKVEIYIPRDLAAAFAAQEATSQEMIDGSVILVDNNRTAIDLSLAKAD